MMKNCITDFTLFIHNVRLLALLDYLNEPHVTTGYRFTIALTQIGKLRNHFLS